MNQTFPELPAIAGAHYAHRMPKWLVVLLRVFFGLGSIGLAVLSFAEWSRIPWGFRGLVAILVPSFAFFALYSRLWKKTTKFVADESGIFFPCNELLVTTLGQAHSGGWLFVPWNRISNIRVSTAIDHEGSFGRCVAFDLEVSSVEKAEFFQHVGVPADRPQNCDGPLAVAYSDFPPSPASVVTRLRHLQHAPATRAAQPDRKRIRKSAPR